MKRQINRIDHYFHISNRGSSFGKEIVSGLTTFFAMVYSVIVIPDVLADVGFDQRAAFISTCLVAAFGSLLMGFWANLPLVIGSAISLTAFTAYSLVLGQQISLPVALGAVFLMGVFFTAITISGVRQWILENIPKGIGHGAGIGIGLFLVLIAANTVGLVIKNPDSGLPVALGEFTSMPVLFSIMGLALIIGLESRGVPGGILLAIVSISVFGLIVDPNVQFQGLFSMPHFSSESTLIGSLDIVGALSPIILPSVFALVLTAIFDATATIHAVAAQAGLQDKSGRIVNGNRALSADSLSSVFAGLGGGPPAAVYIESAAGVAAGGKTGLTAVIVGVLFLFMIFLSPISDLIPSYATAPALMYVGLLMMGNVAKLNFVDKVDALSGLICAVFIVLTANIVTGIMLGFTTLVVGRIVSGEVGKLNIGVVLITLILFGFYLGGWNI